MASKRARSLCFLVVLIFVATLSASAQSFRVQCPTSTITHPITGTNCSTNPTGPGCNNTEPAYNGPTQFTPQSQTAPGWSVPTAGTVNGAIKCQQISGGDGYMTEGDGTQTFMFSFGPLSGLADVAAGRASTQFPIVFNTPYPGTLVRGDPAMTDGAASGAAPWTGFPGAYAPGFSWNGAVGLAPNIPNIVNVTNILEGPVPPLPPAPAGVVYPTGATGQCSPGTVPANTVTVYTDAPLGVNVGDQVSIANSVSGVGATPMDPRYTTGTFAVTCVNNIAIIDPRGFNSYVFTYNLNVRVAGGHWQQSRWNGSNSHVV